MRLKGARISSKLLKNETSFLKLLDSYQKKAAEPEIQSADRVCDLGDGEYRTIVEFNNEVVELTNLEPVLQEEVPLEPSAPQNVPVHHVSLKSQSPKSADEKSPNILKTVLPAPSVSQTAPHHIHFVAICDWLANRWRSVERNHIQFALQIFRAVRQIQGFILTHMENGRQYHSKLHISHESQYRATLFRWQNQFNAIDITRRFRPQFKELMHAQANDFHKQLLDDINLNHAKDMAMHEEVMRNGWTDDRATLIANHFLALMQVRVLKIAR